jgi:hypothetical protein
VRKPIGDPGKGDMADAVADEGHLALDQEDADRSGAAIPTRTASDKGRAA